MNIAKIDEHCRVIRSLPLASLDEISNRIIKCFDDGGKLYILGNGGSAADSQHIAAEFVGRFKHDRKPLPAIALTTDSSVLTAISNDMGAEVCFSRQVEALVTDRDIVWALSVSGTSPNVIRALGSAKSIGATTIGFTGMQMKRPNFQQFVDYCDICLYAGHTDSDRVQEAHMVAYHLICERVEIHYAEAN